MTTLIDGYPQPITEILEETETIETHHHSQERWMGLAASPTATHFADNATMTPFVVTSGTDDFGDWMQILGPDDTPIIAGKEAFDPHRMDVVDVDDTLTTTLIQFAAGDTDAATAYAAGDYTEIQFVPQSKVNDSQPPYILNSEQVPAGNKAWVRAWVDGATDSDISFFVGIHEYDEYDG
jgi:hypothetical protein